MMTKEVIPLLVFLCSVTFSFEELTPTSAIPTNPLLLYSTKTDIRISNTTHSRNNKIKTTIIIRNLTHGTAIDYLYEQKKIYWTDHEQETIQYIQYNGVDSDNKIKVVLKDVPSADGLACDWFTNKLYWTDSETNHIEVATMEGLYRKILFWTDIDQPRAIALVPMKGLLFWTDWGEVPKIERAGMNGDSATRKIIVSENIVWPNGLTVDYDSELVYWIDGNLCFLEVMDFDGKNRTTVLRTGFEYPFALSKFQSKLYWTDWKTWSIHHFDLNSTNQTKEILHFQIISIPMDIHVWDQIKQPKPTKDNNPCGINNGGCSHLCLLAPYPPGYTCACPFGVKLLTNMTCADEHQEMLLLARRSEICLIYLDSPDYSHVILPLTNVTYAIAVDYDPIDKYIYWSDDENKKIQRARLNGSQQEDVITIEVQNPDGIAIDWLSRNLYWTDAGTDRIEVVRLNTPYRKAVIFSGLVEPRAIAVAPVYGWLFWSDWYEKSPKIERANTDGSERILIASKDLGWPNGITLDMQKNKIYWCDAERDRIEFANMDGSDRRELINNNVPHPFGFSLLKDFLYWTDWQRTAIDRAHKETGGQREIIVDHISNVMGLKAIRIAPVNETNLCHINNGNCSQLCFHLHSQVRVCDCQAEYEIADDGLNCVKPNASLLFVKRDTIGRVSIESRKHGFSNLPISGLKHASSIDFDVNTKRIYWSDSKQHTIMRSYINGSDPEKLVEFGFSPPTDIAVDWLGLNIYWTDSVAKRVEVARLSGSSRRTLLWREMYEPHSIVLDPTAGFMYWSEWGKSNQIQRAAMDGSDQQKLLTTTGFANGLALDFSGRRLFWTEFDPAAIWSSDLDGNDKRIVVMDSAFSPLALTLYQNFTYWSEESSGEIWSANKYDGQNRTKLTTLSDSATDILIYPPKQSGSNQCSVSNGGCTHLCLALPNQKPKETFTCACPTHYTLVQQKDCVAPTEFILYTQKSSQKNLIVRLIPDTSDYPEVVLPVQGSKNAQAIDFDPQSNTLYWIESKTRSIRQAEVGGTSSFSTVVSGSGNDVNPHDLVIDPIDRILFWTCTVQNNINVTRLDSNTPFGVVSQRDDEKPRLLALHPTKRLLFYSDVGKVSQLIRTRLDGSHRVVITTLHKGSSDIEAIAVDSEKDYIVWATGNKIYISNIEGENHHELLSDNDSKSKISHLTIHKGWLYWSNKELNQLQRLELQSRKSRTPLNIQASNILDLISVGNLKDNLCIPKSHKRCSHFCILNGTNPVCACSKGKMLQEDKRTCYISPSCGDKHFTCMTANNAKDCIPITWRCDGQLDCSDGMDEVDCPSCNSQQFKCTSNSQCIDHNLTCDGIAHCDDKSDEHTSLCKMAPTKRPNSDTSEILIIAVVIIILMWVSLTIFCIHKRVNKSEIVQEQIEDLLTPAQEAQAKNFNPRKGIPDLVRMSMLTGQSSSYDREHITGASSSTTNGSSGTCYPCETLNPPPSPVTVRGSTCSRYRPYRHYRTINQPPPPTPCSTDVCDESDCNYPTRGRYEGSFPPPPTPRSHCHSESCPPSPSSRASTYFDPLPPPPSPVASPIRGYDS